MCWGYSESFQIYGSMNIVFPICTGVILTVAILAIGKKSLPICVGLFYTNCELKIMRYVFSIYAGVILLVLENLTFISAVSLPICVGVILTSYNGSFDIVGLPYTYVWELFYYPTFICPCLNVFPICVGVILKY